MDYHGLGEMLELLFAGSAVVGASIIGLCWLSIWLTKKWLDRGVR